MPVASKILYGSMPRTRSIARALSRYTSGKIAEEKLTEIYRENLRRYISLVFSYNFTRVSDGMYRWDDLFNPLSSYMGVEVDGLKRFYDNNFFFRQPVFKKRISYESTVVTDTLVEDLRILGFLDRIQYISITFPGPLTLANNSIVQESSYSTHIELARDYVERVILRELDKASRKGVRHVDLHEPELGFQRLSDEYIKLYSLIADSFQGYIWIITYFNYDSQNARILSELSSRKNIVPVFDLVSRKISREDFVRDVERSREIGVGIVDSRNTKMETLSHLRKILSELSESLKTVEKIYVTHNTNLEFLPERIALRKIRLLGRVI
ncbi:MAG: hypothetical protein ABWJ42_00700 [Sulfolobales archaeon]